VGSRERVRAWRPGVPGVAEVFHAHFTEHVYPLHTHDTWTLLIVDRGAVRYDLEHDEHGVLGATVAILPPHVPHNGRSATGAEFRKRVLYLDSDQFGTDLIGRAVDRPEVVDTALYGRISRIHDALMGPGDEFEAESLLSLVRERVAHHLRGMDPAAHARDTELAARLRDLLDARVEQGVGLAEAADLLQAHPTHLVRSFSREYGLPPHRYLTGRRVDSARRLLLGGLPAAEVATTVGFHDQPHLTRHFKRVLGVTPAAYAHSRPR